MAPAAPTQSGRKRIPLWGKILLIVFGLILVTGLLLPYFLDVDRYRSFIVTTIESQTGRKASIGKIRAKFLPSVGFVVTDFHLGNPPGFAPGDVVSVGEIRGNLAWGPLLHKNLQLNSIELVNPKLTLLEDDNGKTNYDFAAPHPAGKSTDGGSSSMKLDVISSLALTGIELTKAHVSRGKVQPELTASKIDVALEDVALDPIDTKRWNGKASLSGVEVVLPGWKVPLKFSSGQVKLAGGTLDAEFEAALGKGADFKGSIKVADVDKGVATFQLSTKQIDFDQLIAVQAETPPTGARQVAQPTGNELVASGKITAERLRWQTYSANNLSAEVRIFKNRMEIWPFSMALYGGTLQVSARADRTQQPQRFSANVQLRNIDVNGAFSAASPESKGKVSGTAELDLQLVGSAAADWQRAISGNGKFTVRDGKLPGLNTGGVAGALAGGLNMKEIPYRSIVGDLNVGGGRVASKNIHLDSPVAVIDLAGSFGFDNSLNYDGKIALASAAAGGGGGASGILTGILGQVTKQEVSKMTVPVSIRGTFSDPKVMPGKGIPTFEGTKTPANSTTPQKKSILDIFKKQ
jgi:AsmA protein